MPENNDFYSVPELADMIQVSRKTVWAWIRDGKLRSTRYGRNHRITKADWQKCFQNFNSK